MTNAPLSTLSRGRLLSRTQLTLRRRLHPSTSPSFRKASVPRDHLAATAQEAPVAAPKRTWTIPVLLQGLCLGVGLVVGGCHIAKRVDVWESWAECAEGLVLELEDHADMDTFWGRLNPHHDLKIGFREGDGEIYDRQHTFYTSVGPYKHRKTFERVHADRLAARLIVLYDPDNPDDCRLADGQHTNLAQLMIYVGVWTSFVCTMVLAVRVMERAGAAAGVAAGAAAGVAARASSGGGGGSGGGGSGGGSGSSLLLLDDRAAFGVGPADASTVGDARPGVETAVVGLASVSDAGTGSSSSTSQTDAGAVALAEELEVVAVGLPGDLDLDSQADSSKGGQQTSWADSRLDGQQTSEVASRVDGQPTEAGGIVDGQRTFEADSREDGRGTAEADNRVDGQQTFEAMVSSFGSIDQDAPDVALGRTEGQALAALGSIGQDLQGTALGGAEAQADTEGAGAAFGGSADAAAGNGSEVADT